MAMIVRAFPLLKSVADLEGVSAALSGERREEAEAFFRKYGLAHESWHLQETPNGPWVIAISVVADPDESTPRYLAATDEFDGWFKQQIQDLTGIDPNRQPLGPPTREVFHWSSGAATQALG